MLILAADRDHEPFLRLPLQDSLDELFFLQHRQDRAHALHITELRLLQHLRRAVKVEPLLLPLLVERLVNQLKRRLIERLVHDLGADALQGRSADGGKPLSRKTSVDDLRHALEILETRPSRHLDDTVLREARVRHQDGDDALLTERQELQRAEGSFGKLRRQDQREILRHARNDLRRFLKDALDALHALPIPIVDQRSLAFVDRCRRKQIIHIETISLR